MLINNLYIVVKSTINRRLVNVQVKCYGYCGIGIMFTVYRMNGRWVNQCNQLVECLICRAFPWNANHIPLLQCQTHYSSIECWMSLRFGIIYTTFNTLRPRQNGRRFAGDLFRCICLNENVWISLKISLKFVPKVPINNIPSLVQILAWRRSGDKPLSEPMMASLLTHICVTRPQWVN